MKHREIRRNVYSVGAIDWDRRLFDALIPLPEGTSYNSYLVKGSEKTALIDTVDPSMQEVLLSHLARLGVDKIDYVVAHHAEQDHSGTLPVIIEKYPAAKIIASPKCRGMLVDLLQVPEEKIITVDDRETVTLGDKTLEFIYTPWVHWPETMVTYLREDRILFSCDFFGAHLATSEMYVSDEGHTSEAAKRYFAEIMMPFRTSIQKNLQAISKYDIDIIAPSHGPLYDRPEFIREAYHHWVNDEPKNSVVLPFVSMHGSTLQMVDYLTEALMIRGVAVKRFDLTATDSGQLAMALVDAATVVIGTPTVLAGAHPLAANAAFLANAVRPNVKFVSIIGSFGWGGKTVEQLAAMLSNLKVEILEPVLSRGFPKEADLAALDNLAETISAKHKENNFI
jgi:flavorubredoxin